MYYMSKKSLACILFCNLFGLISPLRLIAQNTEPLWQITLTGAPSGVPQSASYGFVALSDPRTITAVTESGVILHRYFLKKAISDQFVILPSDHICVVAGDRQTVSLFNPDGVLLWETELPFLSETTPLYLDNGSIIFSGKNQVAALSWNGALLWQTPLQHTWTRKPFLTSWGLIAYPAVSDSGTIIEYLSPYGITFGTSELPGETIAFANGPDTLFALSNRGTIFCLAPEGTNIRTRWQITTGEMTKSACLISTGTRILTVSGSGRLAAYRITDGSELGSESLWNTPLDSLQVIGQGNYTVLAGNTIARTMVYILNDAGKTVWMKNLPSTDPVFLTNTGLLCQYSEDWSVQAWKTPVYRKSPAVSEIRSCIEKWGSLAVSEEYLTLQEVLERLSDRALSSSAVTAQDQYGELGSIIQFNLKDIKASAYTGWDFSPWYARIILNETDTALLKQTIAAAGDAPYDSTRQVLNALEIRLKNNRSGVFDDSLCFETCKTVYSICIFMGTPAVINQGQRILRQLIQPVYSTKVQLSAIETIQKLIDLQKETQK